MAGKSGPARGHVACCCVVPPVIVLLISLLQFPIAQIAVPRLFCEDYLLGSVKDVKGDCNYHFKCLPYVDAHMFV